ncbi:MAG: tetratricopeptide repeat protein [Myxococcales bacterium]|nr:tetratricopeptide repeat protein [Myxococcales bacterium]
MIDELEPLIEGERPELSLLPMRTAPPSDPESWLFRFEAYNRESQQLAQVGNWKKLAAITGYALLHAPYATGTTATTMLLSLASIYRDRLRDNERATEAFEAIAALAPANHDALSYLSEIYRDRTDWMSLYSLYLDAVEATWNPRERVSWTEEADRIANERLGKVELAIAAWERLWQLGDGAEEASRALTRYYQETSRWDQLSTFMHERANRLSGPQKRVALRELAEIKLSALKDPDGASEVLEQLVAENANDPIAVLQLARVYSRQDNITALAELGRRTFETVAPQAAVADVQRLVADSLWRHNKLEMAVEAYDRLLKVDPTATYGIARKREFLSREDRYDELLRTLVALGDATEEKKEKNEQYAEAARLAEEKLDAPSTAIELWERVTGNDLYHLAGFEALTRLHEAVSNLDGVAHSLEAQIRLTRDREKKIALLQRLGAHYAERMGNDDRAEQCWKEILNLDPSHMPVREELIKLHRRRGDFESLNSSLMRQISLTTDSERAERLSRMAAENLDQNFSDSARSAEAWRRVLDFAPLDVTALEALAHHYEVLGRKRDLIATLEQHVRATEDDDARVGLVLRIAELWQSESKPTAAAAAYERILRWDPVNQFAIDELVKLYQAQNLTGRALGVLENAASQVGELDARLSLLRRALDLIGPSDHRARFALLRRLLWLGGPDELVEELFLVAESDASLYGDLAAVLAQMAAEEADPSLRRAILSRLSRLYAEKLANPNRAYLTHQLIFVTPIDEPDLLALRGYAESAERYEDLLFALESLTGPQFSLDERATMIRRRAELLETKVGDKAGAFNELRRLLRLDPNEWAPLVDLERLAGDVGNWPALDNLLAELWDATDDRERRSQLLSHRERLAREQLNDERLAFERVVQRYRVEATPEIEGRLTGDADKLEQWPFLLPLLEATLLADGERANLETIAATATRYLDKLKQPDLAFGLYARAYIRSPQNGDLRENLELIAEETGAWETLADTYRSAIAGHGDRDQTIVTLRRIAQIFEEKLGHPEKAIDIHRGLLHLNHDEVRSLEVMIDYHRGRNELRDLRDRLYQWVFLSEDAAARIEKLNEISLISNSLMEPDGALMAYGQILQLEPENDDAREGLRTLEGEMNEPEQRLQWLEMRLRTTQDDGDATRLRLEMARILEEDLHDADEAISTLEGLLEATGSTGPGFEPLSRLLRERGEWARLVDLLRDRAEQLEGVEAKLETLEEALQICRVELENQEPELHDRLYRFVLSVKPDYRDVRVSLARHLRQRGAYEELTTHLEETLGYLDPADQLDTRYELARLYARNLGEREKAIAIWESLVQQNPEEEPAWLLLASDAWQRNEVGRYLELREKQLGLAPNQEGAHILCHLAEVCDENSAFADRVTPYYRKARGMDPNNHPAREALKGIGRRLKDLRPQAALLPEEGEKNLDLVTRGERLRQHGARESDASAALDWLRRAVAVSPFDPSNWHALADVQQRGGQSAAAFRALRAEGAAIAAANAESTSTLPSMAKQVYEQALAAKGAAQDAVYRRLIQRAHDLEPGYAPSTLAVAEAFYQDGQVESAYQLLHATARHAESLTLADQTRALYNRGLALRQLGRHEEALDDFRAALELDPLHTDCLVAIGELLGERGRIASALEHQIRALTVVIEPSVRAALHHRIGAILEDELGSIEEAGAHYETALSKGSTERDLVMRALKHFQRIGEVARSMEMIDNLLPVVDDPDELATLWLLRGQLHASQEGQEGEALEAFDMALSYDPNSQKAREGLVQILERKEDWEQLTQVLEAAAEQGPARQRADALRNLGEICANRMQDVRRAADYYKRALALNSDAVWVARLRELYESIDDASETERIELLSLSIAAGPPFFDHCVDLASIVIEQSQPWAWCLLSPLHAVSRLDKQLKAIVNDLKNDFGQSPLLCPATSDFPRLATAALRSPLADVLVELDHLEPGFGITDVAQLADGTETEVGEGSSPGKIFNAMAQAMEIDNASLYRARELPDIISIVNSPAGAGIVVRNDVMNMLVKNEAGFVFAYALCMAQPGYRLFASLDEAGREQLLGALFAAIGLVSAANTATAEWAQRLADIADEGTLRRWRDELDGMQGMPLAKRASEWWDAIRTTCRRAGFLACGNLQLAFRVMGKFDNDVPKLKVLPTMERLDEFVDSSAVLRDFVIFAAQSEFGEILANTIPFADV